MPVRRPPRILPSRLGARLYAAGTERLPLKLAALFFAVVLWVVAGAEEPTEARVPVAFAPLHDTALVLAGPRPQLRALVAGRRRELLKLYRSPPVLRYSFLGDLPDTVRLYVGPSDVDVPAGIAARVLDVRPREALLQFVSRDPRRDSLFQAAVESVKKDMGAAASALARRPIGVVIPPLTPTDTTPDDSAAVADSLAPDSLRAPPPDSAAPDDDAPARPAADTQPATPTRLDTLARGPRRGARPAPRPPRR